MAGARRIAAAANRVRRLPPRFVLVLTLAFALLAVAGAQGAANQAQTDVKLEVLGSPIGDVEVTDLDATPPVSQPCPNASVICSFTYSAPRRVRITAPEQETGSPFTFYGWSAAECPGGVNVCELALTGADPVVSVIPLYDPERILVSVKGQGRVTWPEPGGEKECFSGNENQCSTENLPAREPIVFTATPTNPTDPINWAFGCEPDPNDSKRCVSRPENRVLGVGFGVGAVPEPPFQVEVVLRVGKTGDGKVIGDGFNCGSGDGCRKPLAFGRLVTLQAEPAAGSRFDGWVGVCASNPTCRFNAGPVTSVQARFVAAPPPPPPPPPPPSPPPPPKLQVRIIKVTSARKAGRWQVTARIAANKRVSVRARVGRRQRMWGDRTVNLRAGTRSLTIQLKRRARRGKCWLLVVARTAGGEKRTLPRRTFTLGR